jgi:hypothetical protein
MVWQRVQYCALSETPYQIARIEIGGLCVARLNKAQCPSSLTTERKASPAGVRQYP